MRWMAFLGLGALCAPLPISFGQQLEAHWEFDEGSGSLASDSSGNGSNGTVVGPAWVANTADGSAHSLEFDGVDDRVDLGAIELAGDAMTIALWFNADGFATSDGRLLSKATGVQTQQHFWMLSTIRSGGESRLRFRLKSGGNTSTLVADSGALTSGVWTHAAAVYDGSTMRLYKDGVLVGSQAKSGAIDAGPGVAASIGLQPPGAGTQAFDGLIDNVRLYSAALSVTEIQGLITGGNQVPVAVDDGYSVEAGENLVVSSEFGVLANDSDLDGPSLSAQLAENAANGMLLLAADGSFTYSPDPGFVGVDFFSYRATDGSALSNLATVMLNVLAPPGADVVAHYRFDEGSGSLALDSAGVFDGILVGPQWDSETGDGSPFSLDFDGVNDRVDLGAFDVTGSALTIACWLRADDFQVRDGRLVSKATGVQEGQHFWMLSTIFRAGVPTLRFRLRTQGATSTLIGSAGLLTTGTWTHVAAVYDGTAMRLYQDGVEIGSRAKSGPLDVDPSALVAIGSQPAGAGTQRFDGGIDDVIIYRRALSAAEVVELSGGNQAPMAAADSYTLDSDTTLFADALAGVLANDMDAEGEPLSAVLASDVSSGTLNLGADGSFDYTPLPGFAGTDAFQYRASDGNSASGVATVTLTVQSPFGTPPLAVADAYSVAMDASLVVNSIAGVLANDTDADLDPLTAQLVDDVSDGSLALALDGSFNYLPDLGFAGTDSFTYVAFDGLFPSNTVTVTINVQAPPGDELAAHWRMDEGTGSLAADSSGLGNDGTIVGATWSTESADESPYSLSFDGANDRVDIGTLDLPGEALTIACWVRPSGFNVRDGRLVSKATGVQANDHFWMLSTIFRGASPTLRFRLKTDGSTSTLVAATGELSVDTWAHAAAVYDGAFMRLYLDGIEVGSLPKTGSLNVDPSVLAAIGRQPVGAGTQAFAGEIDEVRLYTRALSSAEIAALSLIELPPPTAQFDASGQSIDESGPATAIRVRLSAVSAEDVVVPFTVSGSADGSDYALDASPLTIPAGQIAADIVLTPIDDLTLESDETVVITLGEPIGAELGGVQVHTVVLIDDEVPPIVFTSDDFNTCALAPYWTFTDPVGDGVLALLGAGSQDAQLSLSIPAGTHDAFNVLGVPRLTQPVPNTDFEIEVKYDSILSGSIQDQGVLVLEDDLNWLRFDFYSQGSSLFFYSASTVAGVSSTRFNTGLGVVPVATWMRVNRTGNTWSLSWSANGTTFTPLTSFDHVLSAQTAGVFVGNSGPATTALIDYVFDTSSPIAPEDGPVAGATPHSLSVPIVGSGSVTQGPNQVVYYCSELVSLTAVPDPGWVFDRWEGDVTGNANPTTASMDADRTVTAVFVSIGTFPDIGLASAMQDVAEGDGTVPITVLLSETTTVDVTVAYTLSGTATDSIDYTVAPGVLVIPAGQISGNLLLNVIDDGIDEPEETMVLSLVSATNGALSGIVEHTATLLDNDLPSAQFGLAAQSVPEEGGGASILVTLTSASPMDVIVPFSLSGTAVSPADYSIDLSPLVIPAGQTSGILTLVPADDAVEEFDETVVVTLQTPVGAVLGTPGVHTATLLDDDGPPEVEFMAASQTVSEGDGMVAIVVQLSKVATAPVSVPFSLSGTALRPDDYTSAASPMLIPAGQSAGAIQLVLVDDLAPEIDESIVLTLGVPSGAIPGPTTVHTLTLADDDALSLVSDDFSAPNLRQELWTFVDPFDDATLRLIGGGTADAQLELTVPDTAHAAWTMLNIPRVMQTVLDEDLDVVAKFESQLTDRYQLDGMIFEQGDGANWLRFDFRYDGTNLQAYASRTINNGPATLLTTNIQTGPWTAPTPLFMRVTRTGNVWLYRYSFDGVSWTTVGTFSHNLTLGAIGPFCGNGGTPSPPHTTLVDFVFNQLEPLPSEDAGTPADDAAPFLYRLRAEGLTDTAMQVSWESDELAAGSIEYGLTDAYELGFWGTTAPAAYSQALIVSGLDPETEYHFRVNGEDPSMNVALSVDFVGTTLPAGFTEGPVIDFWYGQDVAGVNTQRFGHLGQPQNWVNLLGNVSDQSGSVVSLSYRLGAGGTPRSISIGDDVLFQGSCRLELPGDFNADIDPNDLTPGLNDVIFTAIDNDGNETSRICRIDYTTGVSWPQSYTIDWSTVTDIQDVLQVVDGIWVIEDDPLNPGQSVLRNTVPGYDRLVAIGDAQWENYEATMPLTANGFNPAGFNPSTNSFALGCILRWSGHSGPETEQPRPGFFPLGGLFAYRWFAFNEFWSHYGTNFTPSLSSFFSPIQIGVPSVMKARVQTLADGSRLYQLRFWEQGQPEPTGWFFQSTHAPFTGNDGGSLLLLSNYIDVSYGNIVVTPLP